MGGLALFLYGMQMMSNGLESVAGNKMKDILEKLTSNRLLRYYRRSFDHSRDPIILSYNGNGRRICKLWNDDIKSGRMDHHGS